MTYFYSDTIILERDWGMTSVVYFDWLHPEHWSKSIKNAAKCWNFIEIKRIKLVYGLGVYSKTLFDGLFPFFPLFLIKFNGFNRNFCILWCFWLILTSIRGHSSRMLIKIHNRQALANLVHWVIYLHRKAFLFEQ